MPLGLEALGLGFCTVGKPRNFALHFELLATAARDRTSRTTSTPGLESLSAIAAAADSL